MKGDWLIIFILISCIAYQIKADDDETRGCLIQKEEIYCCWENNNGCCAPPEPEQICTQAFTECCKIKTYDEESNTYKYKYVHESELEEELQEIPKIDYNYRDFIKSLRFELLLLILILF